MSVSYELPAMADAFRCGILSSKVAAIFNRKPGKEIAKIEHADVVSAANLVLQILKGAKTLSDRSAVTGVTADGIRSFGIALNPLERLVRASHGNSPSDDAILSLLSSIHDTLEQSAASLTIPEQVERAAVVRDFFGFLADALLSNIGRSRDQISPTF